MVLLKEQIPELSKIEEENQLVFDAPSLEEELRMKPKLKVQSTIDSLAEDLRGKFSELENARCLLKKL